MNDICEHGSLKRKCEICERDEQIAALRAEVERLLKIQELVEDYKIADRLNEKRKELETEVERLREALEEYGEHKAGCQLSNVRSYDPERGFYVRDGGNLSWLPKVECTCGLAAALRDGQADRGDGQQKEDSK